MKKLLIATFAIVIATAFNSAQAQFNPYADNVKMLTAGIGFSGWGVPIFARFEAPVADNITVGGGLSYQSYNYSSLWKANYFGINLRGSYHFNELLEINDSWDVYAGLGLNYYFSNYKYKGAGGSVDWDNGGPDGFGVGIHVGGRYFVSEKIGINLEFGGGTSLGGGTIGCTFLL